MPRVSRRAVVAGAAAAVGCRGVLPSSRPNVLVILVDQLRATALSAYGETNIRTPVIDGLLASGAWFENATCADPHCTPARSALMSGLYPSVTSTVTTGLPLPLAFPAWSDQLARDGYRGGYIGKWHIHGGKGPVPVGPARRGFDTFWRAFETNGHRYTDAWWYEDDDVPRRPTPRDRYEPDFQTDHALEFLDAPGTDAFMLVVSYGPPHPPAQLTSTIGDWSGWIPDTFMDLVDPAALTLLPDVDRDLEAAARVFLHGYYAALLSLEGNIQRLLDGLEERGLREDTIVVFTSDHGELAGSHRFFGKERPFDAAIRVPFGVSWPGRIAPRRLLRPTNGVDLAATLFGLTGVDPLPDTHGADLAPLLLGFEEDQAGGAASYVQGRQEEADGMAWEVIRSPEWLYAITGDARQETLHHLVTDPFQQHDLSGDPQHAGILASMRAALDDWRERLG